MKCPITRVDGSIYDVFDFRPEDVNIWEIASALSMMVRFGARCPINWDVLSHVGLCYLLAKDDMAKTEPLSPELTAGILLHDAAEGYLWDVPSPLKMQEEMMFFKELEEAVLFNICTAFGVPYHDIPWDVVARYDKQALHIEARAMFPQNSDTVKWCPEVYPMSKTYPLTKIFPSDWVGIARDIAINSDSPYKAKLLAMPAVLEPYTDRLMRDQAQAAAATKEAAVASKSFERTDDSGVERLRV